MQEGIIKEEYIGDIVCMQFEESEKGKEAWLNQRLNYVTATEASYLMGVHRYNSANSLIEGKKNPKTLEDNIYMQNGRIVEESILLKAASLLQSDLDAQQGFYGHTKTKISVTPDGILKNGTLIEAKGTNIRNWEYWKDYPPLYYLMQVQVQMYILQKTEAYLEAHFFYDWDKTDFYLGATKTYKITYNKELIDILIDKVEKFWYALNNDEKVIVTTEEKEKHTKMLQDNCEVFFSEVLINKIEIDPRQLNIMRQTCFKAASKILQEESVEAVVELSSQIEHKLIYKFCQERQDGSRDLLIQIGALINGYVESGRKKDLKDLKEFVTTGLEYLRK